MTPVIRGRGYGDVEAELSIWSVDLPTKLVSYIAVMKIIVGITRAWDSGQNKMLIYWNYYSSNAFWR